ncbi:hypothetical protein BY996DRAFT_6574112 [Phakopsora pachyrhizi]|nr:hypothetical protein BY996DRAFT_6574112 [Phakopsora pachyrhizi]
MEISYAIQADGQADGIGNVSISCEETTVEDQFRDPETSADGDQITSSVNGQPRDHVDQFSNVADRSNLVSWTPVAFEHNPRNTLSTKHTKESEMVTIYADVEQKPSELPQKSAMLIKSNSLTSNHVLPLDPALDEDSSHKKQGDGAEISVATAQINEIQVIDDSRKPSLSNHPHPGNYAQIIKSGGKASEDRAQQKESSTTGADPSPTSKRKRKSYPRTKPPEQLEREALIEKENPNATKNELRSLKLRALHATRIAEREKDMSEREKARRLRLREYVRKKREEERHMKAQGLIGSENVSVGSKSMDDGAGDNSISFSTDLNCSFHSAPGSLAADHNKLLRGVDIDKKIFQIASKTQSKPPLNGTTRLLSSPGIPCTPVNQNGGNGFSSNNLTNDKKPRRQSSSRVKTPEQLALEAAIEKQNPHATKSQLKSLKLRALHAGRIAERELNLSGKDKARRLKLREYMRRRRDEERTQKGELPLDPNSDLMPHVKSVFQVDSKQIPAPSTNKGSSDTNPSPSPNISRELNSSTELNAADRLAAFSIMELNNYQPQQFSQAPQPSQNHQHANMHLHPLFQMPMSDSALHVENQFSSVIEPSYETINAEQEAQKALHAALEEAIYTKATGENKSSNTNHPQENPEIKVETNEGHDTERLAMLEEERIRVAEEEILGVERARIAADQEMAMIAAAAAESNKKKNTNTSK